MAAKYLTKSGAASGHLALTDGAMGGKASASKRRTKKGAGANNEDSDGGDEEKVITRLTQQPSML